MAVKKISVEARSAWLSTAVITGVAKRVLRGGVATAGSGDGEQDAMGDDPAVG